MVFGRSLKGSGSGIVNPDASTLARRDARSWGVTRREWFLSNLYPSRTSMALRASPADSYSTKAHPAVTPSPDLGMKKPANDAAAADDDGDVSPSQSPSGGGGAPPSSPYDARLPMRDTSFCTTFASLSYFASGTFGRLLITTHRSKVSSMGGYRGCGSRGASEK
jgi:hypothetical protein